MLDKTAFFVRHCMVGRRAIPWRTFNQTSGLAGGFGVFVDFGAVIFFLLFSRGKK
jgi:hypothetical protein